MGKSCWKREEAKTKDATEIAVHEVSHEVETGSRLRVMACMVNTPHIHTGEYRGLSGSHWTASRELLLGRPAPRGVFVSQRLSGLGRQAGSTKEDTVKGAEERRSALKRKVDRLLL